MNKEKFDIIISRDDLFLLIIGLILKQFYKIPLIFQFTIPIKFITELNHKWYSPKNIGGMIKHTLLLKLMKRADLILPISKWMGKYVESYGVNPEKIHNFPDGANLDLFKIIQFPIDQTDPTYVYIGAIAQIRKLDVLINAMKIVCEKQA